MENGGAPQQGEGKDPSGFLGEIINSAVTVKLNSGVVYKGVFAMLYQPSSAPSCGRHPDGSLP
jgi:U6 snRNA-associated Sm-like protein LSm6